MEGKGINFFNRLWRDSLCAIDSLLLNILGTMFWILYWQMYCWLAAGCWLLAACCFCFLFPFPFSFHLISSQKGYTDRQKNGPKKVGPLYSLPPLLITWGSLLTLFTTPLLIASGHYRVSYIPGGARFQPSTVCTWILQSGLKLNPPKTRPGRPEIWHPCHGGYE